MTHPKTTNKGISFYLCFILFYFNFFLSPFTRSDFPSIFFVRLIIILLPPPQMALGGV
jgi:hypothetical protein